MKFLNNIIFKKNFYKIVSFAVCFLLFLCIINSISISAKSEEEKTEKEAYAVIIDSKYTMSSEEYELYLQKIGEGATAIVPSDNEMATEAVNKSSEAEFQEIISSEYVLNSEEYQLYLDSLTEEELQKRKEKIAAAEAFHNQKETDSYYVSVFIKNMLPYIHSWSPTQSSIANGLGIDLVGLNL